MKVLQMTGTTNGLFQLWNMYPPCNLYRIVRSVCLNLWTPEFPFQNTASEIVPSLSLFFITAVLPAGIDSAELTRARVKSDTKWLSIVFRGDFSKVPFWFIFVFEPPLLGFFF